MTAPERPMLPVPIEAAKQVAELYGYDQVVIVARRVGAEPDPYGEHVTTYGVGTVHSRVAAASGRSLQRFMSWPLDPEADPVVKALTVAVMALRGYQYGNSARASAEDAADFGDAALRQVGLAPATLGAS